MLLNYDVGEDSWVSLGLQGAQPVISKGNPPWIFIGGLMLKLKLQYFGHVVWRANSLKKTLMLGKIERGRRRGRQRIRWLDGITDSMDMSLSNEVGDGQGGLACCSPWHRKELDRTERLNWTELMCFWNNIWWETFNVFSKAIFFGILFCEV